VTLLARRVRLSSLFFASLLTLTAAFTGCKGDTLRQDEVLYVSAPQAFLRDRVAVVYAKTGVVHNGDRVVVLEHGRRWVRVRDPKGEEGWIQERYLIGPDVYDGFQKLARDHASDVPQATGVLRNDFRLHVAPGQDTDRLYLLKEGEKLDLLQRTSVPKSGAAPPPPPAADPDAKEAAKEEEKEYAGKPHAPTDAATAGKPATPAQAKPAKKIEPAAPPVPMEDWWLARDHHGHAGWMPGRMVDVDVPVDVAQYAEGQRIVSFHILTSVHDSELNKDVPYYLVLLTEPKDGLPFDYNQARVFSWNLRKHRYETAYRERNLFGMLPVTVGRESFEKEGELTTFTLRLKTEDGNIVEQKYKMNGVIVRRVVPPGSQPLKTAHPNPEKKKRKRR
jgi:SH3-like domain-containing protein